MRRMVIVLLCILLLSTSVLAADEVTSFQNFSTLSSDGSCQVGVNLTVKLDNAVDKLDFPIPAGATDVFLNGQSIHPRTRGHVKMVSLDDYAAGRTGEFPISLQYTLTNLIYAEQDGRLILQLPLLSGFTYPVTSMDFTVTLPGEITARPTFASGYHQESIESNLVFTHENNTISGVVKAPLKDHETLSMSLEVSPEQFPDLQIKTASLRLTDMLAAVFLALAFLYWIAALRCLPTWPIRYSTPPEGVTAGEVGTRLTGAPTDLTMMVISWAQMGYILIHMDDNGRVMLHKRMSMGNERSSFENRCFKSLFGRKNMVDGSGYRYARLCMKVAKTPAHIHGLYRSGSGNPRIFRVLSAMAGIMCGISVASVLGTSTVWFTVFSVILGCFGGISSWIIQSSCYHIHLRTRKQMRLSLIMCFLWILLGLFTGTVSLTAALVVSQLITGFAAAYGGRRNDSGRITMQHILGLRRYLKSVSAEELHHITQTNPDYFYQMAPYALALGVDRAFTRRWGSGLLPDCSYLVGGMAGQMNAQEWMVLLRDTVEALDERYHQLPYERFLGK